MQKKRKKKSFRERLAETRRRYGPPTSEQIEPYRRYVTEHAKRYISQKRDPEKRKLFAEHVRIDRQGYDSRGRYWGTGQKLYRVSDSDGYIDEYVRAPTANQAKRLVTEKLRL